MTTSPAGGQSSTSGGSSPPLEIDGSFGEGGGQTIRIATSFAIILNRAVRVSRVRAGRKVPGLRPQHSATLRILADICGGRLEGGAVGSTEFTFSPGIVESRSMTVDTGTAASATLALQGIIPAVALSGASLELDLIGGTDVPWSPTCDYFSTVFSPSLRALGLTFRMEVLRRGYYPRGGGKVRVAIEPCRELRGVDLVSRDAFDPPISVVSRAGSLPQRVADQLVTSAVSELEMSGLSVASRSARLEDSSSPGCSILVSSVGPNCYMGQDSIGVRGKPAFRVGAEAGARFAGQFKTRACVDPHLADMLAPLLFLARTPSRLLTTEVTGHLRTSMHVANIFAPADYCVEPRDAGQMISITPRIPK